MSAEREFEAGEFVWLRPRLEAGAVVGRVIHRRGSQYHVAWASLGGNLFDLCVDPDELTPVAPSEAPPAAPTLAQKLLSLPEGDQAAQAATEPDGKAIAAAPPSEAPPPPQQPDKGRRKRK